ncbi:MAG TPA: sensor histidine kinase [Ktedonobacteraceae bacterium]|jgi:two-component system sensor histidine kinase UhpB|nr:sensor histidine kinase [Ktedonobacteraceae bacterium]
MQKHVGFPLRWLQRWHLSLFEKVILVNSIMLIAEAVAGVWVTSHHLETQHYLIDTGFIVLATLLTLLINIVLLRMSFQPLFGLLFTIRKVSAGNPQARAPIGNNDDEIGELANAFNSMLDRLEQAYREQTRLILQAQEDERRRIGLELHDEAGQNLTALLVHAEILQQTLQTIPATSMRPAIKTQLEGSLQQLSTLTQGTLESIRVLAQQLRPSVLEDLGLLPAFRWLVEDSAQRLHLQVTLHIQGFPPVTHPLPPSYETALFRIAQESLTNIARHARTQQATLRLCQEQDSIRLEIQDDGQGYLPSGQRSGLGIFGMRERAIQIGGSFSIQAHNAGGTLVQTLLPLPTEEVTPEQRPLAHKEEHLHV